MEESRWREFANVELVAAVDHLDCAFVGRLQGENQGECSLIR